MSIREISLLPEEAFDEKLFQAVLYSKLGLKQDGDRFIQVIRRSIDARGKKVVVRVQYETIARQEKKPLISYLRNYREVSPEKSAIIVGSGPAGLFAALRLIELGIKPIVLERGSDVQSRRHDLAAINKRHLVNPDSNYCFGEGGAGTYSDGKLYTRSKKRGDVRRILEILVAHGAKEEILYDAHPHIGTNKLPKLVQEIRSSILQAGGEIYFNTKMTDVVVENNKILSVRTHAGDKLNATAVILATGHSARDIFELLYTKKILLEPKPFALGVRVEHQQNFVDRVQYHCSDQRGDYLPAAAYSLVHQAKIGNDTRGVFSFCMCPGGFMVPSATSPGEVVVNGMSPSKRDSKFANSGIVVTVELEDYKKNSFFGPLAGMYFQAEIEKKACTFAGGRQSAPAQLLVDFVESKVSTKLLETSYQPGLVSVALDQILPSFVTQSLKQGFRKFGEQIKGYLTNEAQVVGVESRTSSPVRIPRDKQTLQHPQIQNLFPCGEGAGYAGGIVSAAMDGERCAEAVNRILS